VSFRRKLLTVFALTVCLSVAAVTRVISTMTRRAFEKSNEERTAALVAQFRREFDRRGEDVLHHVENIAASEPTTRMALALSRGSLNYDYGAYLNQAKNIAENQQLDFLQFVSEDGTILSSAQWPAKFGYRDMSVPLAASDAKGSFLRKEELPEGAALSLSAIRMVHIGDKTLYVVGGRRIDKAFMATLELPAGMRAMLYQNLLPEFSSHLLVDPSAALINAEPLRALIQQTEQQKREITQLVHWNSDPSDDETVRAIPLMGQGGNVPGVLLIGASRRPYVELRQHIRSAGLLVGSLGIVLSVLLSGWAAARVTRPVEQLAEAARRVAAGDWNTRVDVTSTDELGELASSFNRMTNELLDQKERLVQTERVAAWRELARRLAHELKNPLFPLQLTVENLIRARQQTPEHFDEVFHESSATLLAEITNLKAIISRFSDFSKMPQPQFQLVQLNEVVKNAARLFQSPSQSAEEVKIQYEMRLQENMQDIAADPDLLHRAISNLLLNAVDAMPHGGVLTLQTRESGDNAFLAISDTGTGLSVEECQRLFTPYYTTKAHGTGLGLAMVQSAVSDHGGKITVQSAPGRGTTFIIELPRILDKSAKQAGSASA